MEIGKDRERNSGAVGSKWLLCPNGRLKARKWMRSGRQSMWRGIKTTGNHSSEKGLRAMAREARKDQAEHHATNS